MATKFNADINKIIEPDYFTPRQLDILKLKLRGLSVRQIAQELVLSEHTINDRVREIRRTLNLPAFERDALFKWAIENGLLEAHFE